MSWRRPARHGENAHARDVVVTWLDVLALLDHHPLDLAGTYGRPDAGDPTQSDELRIEHDEGASEIVVYHRAILLFTTDSEAVRRTHQLCCRLDDIAGSRRPA